MWAWRRGGRRLRRLRLGLFKALKRRRHAPAMDASARSDPASLELADVRALAAARRRALATSRAKTASRRRALFDWFFKKRR